MRYFTHERSSRAIVRALEDLGARRVVFAARNVDLGDAVLVRFWGATVGLRYLVLPMPGKAIHDSSLRVWERDCRRNWRAYALFLKSAVRIERLGGFTADAILLAISAEEARSDPRAPKVIP